MNQTCYLVALIDMETAKVESVGLYSQARPTHHLDKAQAVLETTRAQTFSWAYGKMLRVLADPHWNWVRPLLTLPVGTTIPQLEEES